MWATPTLIHWLVSVSSLFIAVAGQEMVTGRLEYPQPFVFCKNGLAHGLEALTLKGELDLRRLSPEKKKLWADGVLSFAVLLMGEPVLISVLALGKDCDGKSKPPMPTFPASTANCTIRGGKIAYEFETPAVVILSGRKLVVSWNAGRDKKMKFVEAPVIDFPSILSAINLLSNGLPVDPDECILRTIAGKTAVVTLCVADLPDTNHVIFMRGAKRLAPSEGPCYSVVVEPGESNFPLNITYERTQCREETKTFTCVFETKKTKVASPSKGADDNDGGYSTTMTLLSSILVISIVVVSVLVGVTLLQQASIRKLQSDRK